MAVEPFYEHDACPDCGYLGPWGNEDAVWFDLWFCTQGGAMPTVLARYGNDEPEYYSGIGSQTEPLIEAKRRARRRGLWDGSSVGSRGGY